MKKYNRKSVNFIAITLSALFTLISLPNGTYAYPSYTWHDITRQEISAIAKEMVYSKWVSPVSVSGEWGSFTKGVTYTGVAYTKNNPQEDWDEFKKGIDNSSGRPGIELGADCSGFVSNAWRLPTRQTTSTIEGSGYADVLSSYGQLKEGDALNDAGSHIILFRKKIGDDRILAYEETPDKAVSRLHYERNLINSGYKALRRKKIVYQNDISSMYDYSSETRIHGFSSNGSAFSYSGSNGWWSSAGYPLSNVKNSSKGDFNGNGDGDLVTLYDYGNGETRFHMWLGDGSKLNYQGSAGWWQTPDGTTYPASGVKKMAAGDFNRDNKTDLATMYYYGNGETRIHVFLSNGNQLNYQGPSGWWQTTSGYDATKVKDLVSGDFNGDGKTDLCSIYDYGNGETRFHLFQSTGSSFAYQGSSGWWQTPDGTTYPANGMRYSLGGDYNADGLTDIAVMYSYNTAETRIHMFLSAMDSTNFNSLKKFEYQGPNGWWQTPDGSGYNASNVKNSLVGDFNMDGVDDIANLFDYGSGSSRIHIFLSSMTNLNYQGSSGWWKVDSGYDLKKVPQSASGYYVGW